ncbi:type II toxin-antitoxin system VapC family toxin [Aquibium carbonis]|jgi:toxin FitB|uniref:Type II toxin-antitoxin system VapC family toxin n=1 Tax=Aquibium carbonis TaxID=2495581 RepID=A0A3R9Y6W5_9HYPH|nr:PIN domain-containing protein [Aquibium carbonis]RST85501.1 type II toxin-antitoxin system VapC family toxin [Aquibium carbonis]
MFLLDTNVLSELSRSSPNPRVVTWIESAPEGSLAMSFSAVIEIQRGIANVDGRKPNKAEELRRWFEELLHSDIIFLPMDAETARLYAAMTMVPALRSFWVPDPGAKCPKLGQDLAIAASAIRHDAVIVSLDVGDFQRIHRHFTLPGVIDPEHGEWAIPVASPASATRQSPAPTT